jgi:hypothetical protein
MEKKRKQEIQHIKNPSTGETMDLTNISENSPSIARII